MKADQTVNNSEDSQAQVLDGLVASVHSNSLNGRKRRKAPAKSLRKRLPRKSPDERRARLSELLAALGYDVINVTQFRGLMAEDGFTDDDIDRFCAEQTQ